MTATPTPDDGAALPNWALDAIVRQCCEMPCDTYPDTECKDHELCVTEYCAPCLARWTRTLSPAPVSGEAAERAAAEIMGRFAVHRSERNLKEIAAIIQHCAGAGREGG